MVSFKLGPTFTIKIADGFTFEDKGIIIIVIENGDESVLLDKQTREKFMEIFRTICVEYDDFARIADCDKTARFCSDYDEIARLFRD
jgi:hypothetical protein